MNSLLVEGNSIRSAEWTTSAHRDTIMRLAVQVGENCQRLHDERMKGFHAKYIQCDEILSQVGKKQGRLIDQEKRNPALGDVYTFVGLDAETKLVPSFHGGNRDGANTMRFAGDLRTRLNGNGRVQLRTDGWWPYQDVVNWHFGRDVDYGQQIRMDRGQYPGAGRYFPPRVSGAISTVLCGNPDTRKISTSYVGRQNLTMRMSVRRLARLTSAFSKKLDNLKAAVALHFAYCNFCRIHQILRATPARAAGSRTIIGKLTNFWGSDLTKARMA